MEKVIQKFKNLMIRLRYGTLFEAFQYRLSRLGIKISPYYFVREGIFEGNKLNFSSKFDDYSFEFLGHDEIKQIVESKAWEDSEQDIITRLKDRKKCYCAKYKGQIAAFMWINFQEFICEWFTYPLKDDEACLYAMYTMEPFRGKGLAPILRYKCYEILKEMGRDKCYSCTDFFNKPAIKFKKKLNAKNEKVGIYIRLFNKFHWNWLKH